MEHAVEAHIHSVREVEAFLVQAEIAGSKQFVLILHHTQTGGAATLRVVGGGESFVDLPEDQGRALLAKFAEYMEAHEGDGE